MAPGAQVRASRVTAVKIEPLVYGDRKVYTVAGFNRGVADWLARLPTLWIEGEVTELRRHERWSSVFFTLKDPADGACLPASMPRRGFDALRLDLADGERVHVYGRPELYAAKGELRLRVLSIERFGLGAHLASIERLKQALATEGLFDAARKRALPRFPGGSGSSPAATRRRSGTSSRRSSRGFPRPVSSWRRRSCRGRAPLPGS